jgi:hypothetical protein
MNKEIRDWNARCKYLENVYWLEEGTIEIYKDLIEDIDYVCYDTENSLPQVKIDRIVKAFHKNGYQIYKKL